MPTLHRVRFDNGAVVLFQLRDLPVPVLITSQFLVGAAAPIAVRDPANGDRWRFFLRGRRGAPLFVNLTPAGSTTADAAPQASPDLPADLLPRLLV